VIVAVSIVWVVQVAVHQVIGVVAVRHSFVAAARAVLVRLGVSAAVVAGSAIRRVSCVDRQSVLLHPAAGVVVQVAVVEVIDVPFVLDAGVPAAGAVLVRVIRMSGSHRDSPSFR
jgi:hypothetical protein